ncbi:C1 family peptidase [Nostocaceae cyanobacterium CENA357]|uniref:C1 family peptidase n=1 Tax=Atlanticothrix silvestris CENA357 TaxID=1725252 RepID=A0A8J7HLZ9_9CYAN|nr:C1 family peptidase [Atlanticothrix silvestris]MBH8555619.1 C1 family peptidase [Atlanticothrix silvestris CENA357]
MGNSGNQQQQSNWKKKGLGWIPDYPDLRDYNLDNEEGIKNKLRFKIEEGTRNFEKLVEDLINLVSDLTSQNCSKEDRIEQFKNQIFGNVLFAKVKVHKLLREIPKDSDPINNLYPINPVEYESILSNQIVDLKKYLGVLFMKEYLRPNEIDSEIFKDPGKIVEWMRNSEYDPTTKSLVKVFQSCSNILVDGIVGLETYTTFNEYFSDPEKLSKLKDKECEKLPKRESLSKIKFFAVTSLISRSEFGIILDILKCKIIDQIKKEYALYIFNNPYGKIFEYEFLTKIGAPNKLLFEEMFNLELNKEEKNLKHTKYQDQIENFINEICSLENKNKSIKFSNIVTILQNSSISEPIFSVITRVMSPLSQWSDLTWEEMIRKGFEDFENIATNTSNTEPGYSKEELVKSAIFQVISLLKLEILSFIEEPDDEKDTSELFVYFLLKKYLNQFEKYTSDIENEIQESQIKGEELKSNIFDKQEVFEVELLFNYGNSSSNLENSKQKKSKELFPNLNLHIPVVISNSYLKKLTISQQKNNSQKKLFFLLPAVIDLSFWCSPVRDQGSLNSCTAFAAIALLEYFENRNFGKSTDASPLFLYKAARQKMNVEGDLGVSIRETIKVLALFGVPPEESWPYKEDKVDEEPPSYCYAYAQNYKTLKYFLLDYAGITTESLLFQIKAVLAAGFPCIFGLTLYTSAYEESNSKKGHIPYPDPDKDKVVGGHTAVVVGYDDYKFIRCASRKYYSRGAFLIRNSWGSEWGVNGYGWLPYDYVLAGLTAAWWSLLKAEWFDESNFGSARKGGDGADRDTQGSGSPPTSRKSSNPK